MSVKEQLSFISNDGKTNIKCSLWKPENSNPKAVLQIVHGMQEYIDRYEDFANFLVSYGYVVVGDDHLGHGRTAKTNVDLGYISHTKPDEILVEDERTLKEIVKKEYSHIPYFILGHSMGSFILRRFLNFYGDEIDGAIISGTGNNSSVELFAGLFLSNIIKLFRGEKHRSKMITKLSFGSFTKKIKDAKTEQDWLSRDENVVEKYRNDPKCMFTFTVNGYITLFHLVKYTRNKKSAKNISQHLPIFIFSGDKDPVGNYGKAPSDVWKMYDSHGVQDLSLKIYHDFRHESLNEIGKEECYKDILDWLEQRVEK